MGGGESHEIFAEIGFSQAVGFLFLFFFLFGWELAKTDAPGFGILTCLARSLKPFRLARLG